MSWTRLPRVSVVALAFAPLGACAVVGPDFVRPQITAPAGYLLAGEKQSSDGVALGHALPGDWWSRLGVPGLDAIVIEALLKSPTLAEADAALDAALATRDMVYGGSGVSVDGQAGFERGRINSTSFGFSGFPSRTLSRYTTGVGVSYDLDLFGGAVREQEVANARVESEAFRREAARLTLASEIASKAIEIAAANAEVTAAELIVADGRATLRLVEQSIAAGAGGEIDRIRAQAQLAQDEAALPALRERHTLAQHALAILTGNAPGASASASFDLGSMSPPAQIPVAIPSELIHGRPDILAAEAVLHAATAEIGVRTANLYPQIRLSARLTQTTLQPEDLFSYSSSGWSFGPQLSLPLFRNGALKADVQRAEAEARRADARYRATVLRAFGEVADAMASLESAETELALQLNARDLAEEALRLERRNYELGGGRLLDVLTAQRQASLARLSFVRATARRLRAIVRLSSATAFSPDALRPVHIDVAAGTPGAAKP